jgi:hypothetical protein
VSHYDPHDTAAQDRERAERLLREKLAAESEEADIRWLMSSKRGRRILWRLLDQSGVFRLSFNPNAMHMAFAEGTRNFGNRMLAMIHSHCPEHYTTMVKEHNDRNADGVRKPQ